MAVDVMAIGAHPDDVEIGMGGTVAALVAAGKKVVIVDLSDGEPTPHGTHERRMQEASQAAKILGVTRETLDIPNREIMDNVENRKKVAAVIRKYRPQILCIPYNKDAHPDHTEACALVQAARFYAKFVKSDMPYEPFYPRKVLHYLAMHIRAKVIPSFMFDTTAFVDKKMQALAAYESQFKDNENNRDIFKYIKADNAFWGNQIGVEFGEPFVGVEYIKVASAEGFINV